MSKARVVLDTNVLVSALLFEGGRLAWLRRSWQNTAIKPVLAGPTTRELLRVLTYSKFRLSPSDRDRVLEDLLPWCESWTDAIPACGLSVRDPSDQVFLDLAIACAAPVLVSGDADLLALGKQTSPLLVLTPADFQAWLSSQP